MGRIICKVIILKYGLFGYKIIIFLSNNNLLFYYKINTIENQSENIDQKLNALIINRVLRKILLI